MENQRASPPGAGLGHFPWVEWTAKLGIGVLFLAGLAWTAGPTAAAAFATVFPAVRSFLVPPYLFITVHVIILVIWKLSDHKQHDEWNLPRQARSSVVEEAESARGNFAFETLPEHGKLDERLQEKEVSSAAVWAKRANPPLPKPESPPFSGESDITTESDEAPTVRFIDGVVSRSVGARTERVTQRKRPPPPTKAILTTEVDNGGDEIQDDDSIETMWKAIMERSTTKHRSPPPRPAPQPVTTPRSRPRARAMNQERTTTEDMNRRFEDFIKKNKDQIRFQMDELKLDHTK